MPKKPKKPWYWAARGGWHTTVAGKRKMLARGAPDDNYVRSRAWLAFWALHQTPLIERVRAVDWLALSAAQQAVGNTRWADFFCDPEDPPMTQEQAIIYVTIAGKATEDQMRGRLSMVCITEETMSLFVR